MHLDATVGASHITVTALHLKWLVIVSDVIWEVSQKNVAEVQHNLVILFQKASQRLRMHLSVDPNGIVGKDLKQIEQTTNV